jgi:hypothetical protein
LLFAFAFRWLLDCTNPTQFQYDCGYWGTGLREAAEDACGILCTTVPVR